jgi:hypothetical protein
MDIALVTKLIESDFVALMNFSHSPENCIWIWYYREDTKELEGYTTDIVKSHSEKEKFRILDNVTSYVNLQRGRVIKHGEQYANLVYTDTQKTTINEFIINDITYKIEKALGIMVLGTVNQDGVSLIERKK